MSYIVLFFSCKQNQLRLFCQVICCCLGIENFKIDQQSLTFKLYASKILMMKFWSVKSASTLGSNFVYRSYKRFVSKTETQGFRIGVHVHAWREM